MQEDQYDGLPGEFEYEIDLSDQAHLKDNQEEEEADSTGYCNRERGIIITKDVVGSLIGCFN